MIPESLTEEQEQNGPMPGLTEGRIVHYVLPDDISNTSPLEHRPAIIVKVWDRFFGTVNLQVFTDGANDGMPSIVWKTSIRHDKTGSPGTWHFIEPA